MSDSERPTLIWSLDETKRMFKDERLWPSFVGAKKEIPYYANAKTQQKANAGLLPVLLWKEQQQFLENKKKGTEKMNADSVESCSTSNLAGTTQSKSMETNNIRKRKLSEVQTQSTGHKQKAGASTSTDNSGKSLDDTIMDLDNSVDLRDSIDNKDNNHDDKEQHNDSDNDNDNDNDEVVNIKTEDEEEDEEEEERPLKKPRQQSYNPFSRLSANLSLGLGVVGAMGRRIGSFFTAAKSALSSLAVSVGLGLAITPPEW